MHKTVGGTTAVTAALTITTVVCSKHATTINDTNYTANENKLHCSKITKRINSKPSVVQISMLSSLNYGAVSKKNANRYVPNIAQKYASVTVSRGPGSGLRGIRCERPFKLVVCTRKLRMKQAVGQYNTKSVKRHVAVASEAKESRRENVGLMERRVH